MVFFLIFEIDDVIVAITTLGATMVAHVSCVEFRLMVLRRWHKEDKTLKMLCPWFIYEFSKLMTSLLP